MATLLHHPLSVPALIEAMLLDRLSPTGTLDGDRPSIRFLASRERAMDVAQSLQESDDPQGIHRPGEGDWCGAVVSFDRALLASATSLVRAPGDAGEAELRARSELRGVADGVRIILLADEEIDRHAAAYASGHPEDDGTGRLTKAALALLDDLYADPRRMAPDRPPPLPRVR